MGIGFARSRHLMTPSIRTRVRAFTLAMALAGITVTLSAQSGAPAHYVVQDLGQADGVSSTATSINDNGVVAGWIQTVGHGTRAARAVDGGIFQYVPGLETASAANGINAIGQLTGYVASTTSPGDLHAMRYTDGLVEDLGSFGGNSFAYGINRHGQVAGWSFTPGFFTTRAFVATPGQPLLDLGNLGGGAQPMTFASGINDAGQVAGHSVTNTGRWHAFRYAPGVGRRRQSQFPRDRRGLAFSDPGQKLFVGQRRRVEHVQFGFDGLGRSTLGGAAGDPDHDQQ